MVSEACPFCPMPASEVIVCKCRTRVLAEREGWNLGDLVASQTYGSFQRRKTFLLERINENGKWYCTAPATRRDTCQM